MYRIEVAPGEVTVFRTIEELAVGIRNGVITARARIYHHASQKWLPIGLHPHYKKALEMPVVSTGSAPVTAATPIPASPRLKPLSPAHPRPHSEVYYPEPERSPEPAHAPEIPPPRPSPVIAMHHEILRDLPVVSLPEPLPWNVPAPKPAAAPVEPPPPARYVAATQAPAMHAPAVHAQVAHAPAVHAPAIPTPAAPAPAPFPPSEFVAPVAEAPATYQEPLLPRPTARRSRRLGGRPLLLLGTAAALVIGTHLALTTARSPSAGRSKAPVRVAGTGEPEASSELPSAAGNQPAAETKSAASRTAGSRVTIAPARVPMTPGPAFAGSVSARPGADSAVTPKSVPAPIPAPAATAPSITPAPEAIETAVPDFQPDLGAPPSRASDTLGMKKILRALNGTKEAPAPPAE